VSVVALSLCFAFSLSLFLCALHTCEERINLICLFCLHTHSLHLCFCGSAVRWDATKNELTVGSSFEASNFQLMLQCMYGVAIQIDHNNYLDLIKLAKACELLCASDRFVTVRNRERERDTDCCGCIIKWLCAVCVVDVALLAAMCQEHVQAALTTASAVLMLEATSVDPPSNLSAQETQALLEANGVFTYVCDQMASIVRIKGLMQAHSVLLLCAALCHLLLCSALLCSALLRSAVTCNTQSMVCVFLSCRSFLTICTDFATTLEV